MREIQSNEREFLDSYPNKHNFEELKSKKKFQIINFNDNFSKLKLLCLNQRYRPTQTKFLAPKARWNNIFILYFKTVNSNENKDLKFLIYC